MHSNCSNTSMSRPSRSSIEGKSGFRGILEEFLTEYQLDSTLEINHKMSASYDELLYRAARDGDLAKMKDLLSRVVGTDYRNEVSYLI